MQPIRQIGIPVDHLVAEIAAFPLVSEHALRRAITSLDPQLGGETGPLWRAAEASAVGHFPGFSVDEVVNVRDRCWFINGTHTVPLHRYLACLAGELLEMHGHVAVPRLRVDSPTSASSSEARLAQLRRSWRWLGFALPPDLLLAVFAQPGLLNGVPDAIQLLSPALERQLQDRGFAEIHLHLGAAIEFPLLWVRVLHRIGDPDLGPDEFQSPGAALDEGRQLASWLLRAALARYLLAVFLNWGQQGVDFGTFLATAVPARVRAAALPPGFLGLKTALLEFAKGTLPDPTRDFSTLQNMYAVLAGLGRADWTRVRDADGVLALDPISDLLRVPELGRASPEVRWVREAIQYLEGEGAEDALFTRLFWQTVRARALFYRHVTQRPLTPGLQWFVRFYDRIWSGTGDLEDRLAWELAADLGGRNHGLRSLEARRCPTSDDDRMFGRLVAIDRVQAEWSQQALPGELPLELGLVLHFSKQRGGGAGQGIPVAHGINSNADPRVAGHPLAGEPMVRNPSFRFAKYYNEELAKARTVARVLRDFPLSLQIVRGIDLCTDEMGVPNWIFVRIFQLIRDAANVASGVVRARTGWTLPGLRTTIHAGEDFVHLLNGLRHVDEAIEQLGLREGDRIGHGVALGIDPRTWANQAGRLAMPCEERLFDLVWEWTWYGKQRMVSGVDRLTGIEYEIAQLSERIFRKAQSPFVLQQLREDLANPGCLAAVGFPDRRANPPPRDGRTRVARERARLLWDYLTDGRLFDRGRETIWVDPAGEGEALAHLQAELRRKLGAGGIVVEVNPTSNLLIGDLEDLTNHPMWRLRPPCRREEAPPPVGVCIGSDDPVTFNCNLRQEYQCLLDAMLLGGLSDDQAGQWLEEARLCTLDHRFTIPRKIPLELEQFTYISTDPLDA